MRKKVFGRKLSRNRKSRTALFRSLVRAFVENGKMTTTKAKSKAVQPMIERFVSMAKTGDVATLRRLYANLGNDRKTLETLSKNVAGVFKDVKGGYTKMINLPRRLGDNAEMVRMEWSKAVEMIDKKKDTSKSEKKDAKAEVKKPALKSKIAKLVKKDKK